MSDKNNCRSLRVFWQTCWEWRCVCSSLQWFCSSSAARRQQTAAAGSVARPPSPCFMKLELPNIKILFILGGERGRGSAGAAGGVLPAVGGRGRKLGRGPVNMPSVDTTTVMEDDRTGAPPPVSGQWGARGGAATNGVAGPSCELSLHVNEMLVADDIGHIHACQAAATPDSQGTSYCANKCT